MAKKSMIARDEKRKRMITRYAAKRAALKQAGDQEGLQKLPRNSSPTRWKWPPAWLYAPLWPQPY